MRKANIAVLVSGGGTNLQALLDAQKCGVLQSGVIRLVVSHNPKAYALTRAERAGVEHLVLTGSDFEERLEADGKRYLEYVEMLASSKGVKCQKDLRKGGVFSEVLKSAEEFEADLILLGGNIREVGKTGIKHNFLSSAETSILSNSKCPVMIIHYYLIQRYLV